jgi:hypothetical protein
MTELQLTPNDLRNFAKLAEQQGSSHVTIRPDFDDQLVVALADNTTIARTAQPAALLDSTLPAHLR